MDIKERLDKLKERFKDEKFQSNKGLSNQLGIYIFDYDPKDEMIVRSFLNQIKNDSFFNAIEHDLYDIMLEVLNERKIADRIPILEERSGKEVVEKQIKSVLPPNKYIEKMKYDNHKKGDILIIFGVGKVYPFTRVHTLIENIGEDFGDIPVVIFYPGKYDGRTLTLFNKFFDDNHYRSFTILK